MMQWASREIATDLDDSAVVSPEGGTEQERTRALPASLLYSPIEIEGWAKEQESTLSPASDKDTWLPTGIVQSCRVQKRLHTPLSPTTTETTLSN